MDKFHIVEGSSHLDHHLTAEHVAFMRDAFRDRTGFFIETVELPSELPELPNGIYGPSVGDEPVSEDEVFYAIRRGRPWPSRFVDRPVRTSRLLTAIAGPTLDCPEECMLYTAFGGPAAKKEPGDFSLGVACKDHREDWKRLLSRNLTSQHELSAAGYPLSGHCPECRKAWLELYESLGFWQEHALTVQDCELVLNSRDERLRNLRSKSLLFLSVKDPGERYTLTCDACEKNSSCPHAFNPFNIAGLCLFNEIMGGAS